MHKPHKPSVPKKTVRSILVSYICSIIVIGAAILLAFSFMPSATTIWDKLIAGSGLIAVVLGLAAQASLGNVFCGFMIMANRPYEIGDRVEIGADTGYVTNITLQYTCIQTYLNESILVPNSVVSGERIKNYSKIIGASYPIEICITYGNDVEKAKKIIQDTVFGHQKFYGVAKPTVLVKSANEIGITLKAVVTTKSPDDNPVVCSECLQRIIRNFAEEGIEVPKSKYITQYRKGAYADT